jgi:hypothetical protein
MNDTPTAAQHWTIAETSALRAGYPVQIMIVIRSAGPLPRHTRDRIERVAKHLQTVLQPPNCDGRAPVG